MKLWQIRRLVRMRSVELNATKRRLDACHDVPDLRRAAKRRVPAPVFDYVDGAADEELAAAANVAAFRRWQFQPRVLVDVRDVDTATTLFDGQVASPFVLGPVGYTRMLHPDGELGAIRAAARHGLPYTLSTMATTGVEAAAAAGSELGPERLWFQFYMLKARDRAMALLERAQNAGYKVLVVTVDTPIGGNRIRDNRNSLSPSKLSLRTVLQVASRPAYWYRLLSGPALTYSNFADRTHATGEAMTPSFDPTASFDPTTSWDTIAELRSMWPGKLVLKGPIGPADALRAVGLGVDGIQLSNHGGRQLDRVVPPVDLIAPVREAVGASVTLLVDSGIRHGADAVVALALGADAVALGRAYAYGLMAGGEAGVDRALDILTAQFRSTMTLLGVTSVAELHKQGHELLTAKGALF